MSKPRSEPEEKNYYKNHHVLYEVFNQLKDRDEIKSFLTDILTPSELRMIKKRWHIVQLLSQGLDIRTVASRAHASTTTVMKLKNNIAEENGGLTSALQRMYELQKKEDDQISLPTHQNRGSKFIKKLFR